VLPIAVEAGVAALRTLAVALPVHWTRNLKLVLVQALEAVVQVEFAPWGPVRWQGAWGEQEDGLLRSSNWVGPRPSQDI